ncbi:hypothetical protein ACHAWF_015974 [Thalassiosira exigua]
MSANTIPTNSNLFYAKGWEYDDNYPEWDTEHQKIVAAPKDKWNDMVRLSLAPKFVFDSKATNEPSDDCMDDVYMKRLICVLCRRFVVIPRPSDPKHEFENDGGMPQDGKRYWWRYWDNEGNVWQVNMTKWRGSADEPDNVFRPMMTGQVHSFEDLEDATAEHGYPPGEFEVSDGNVVWMRVPSNMTSSGKEYTDLSAFFDHAFAFIHSGSTRVLLWDANLNKMAQQAGYIDSFEDKFCNNCANPFGVLRCNRCKISYYCNNGTCQREDWPHHKKMCKYFSKPK